MNTSVSMNANEIPPAKAWLLAARPKTLPAAFAPVAIGSALAYAHGSFAFLPAFLALLFAITMQIGANFANDYFDFVNGADTPSRIGFQRAVASGWISPDTMLLAMILTFSLALLFGLGLIYFAGPWLLAVGLLCIVFAIAYTGGPIPLAYIGLGEVLVFIFFGLVAVMFTFYSQAGTFTMDVFLTACAIGFLAINILLVNNIRDRETDADSLKKTIIVSFGKNFGIFFFLFNGLFAFSLPAMLHGLGYNAAPFLSWLTLPLFGYLFVELVQADSGPRYNSLLAKTAIHLMTYSILMTIGICWG